MPQSLSPPPSLGDHHALLSATAHAQQVARNPSSIRTNVQAAKTTQLLLSGLIDTYVGGLVRITHTKHPSEDAMSPASSVHRAMNASLTHQSRAAHLAAQSDYACGHLPAEAERPHHHRPEHLNLPTSILDAARAATDAWEATRSGESGSGGNPTLFSQEAAPSGRPSDPFNRMPGHPNDFLATDTSGGVTSIVLGWPIESIASFPFVSAAAPPGRQAQEATNYIPEEQPDMENNTVVSYPDSMPSLLTCSDTDSELASTEEEDSAALSVEGWTLYDPTSAPPPPDGRAEEYPINLRHRAELWRQWDPSQTLMFETPLYDLAVEHRTLSCTYLALGSLAQHSVRHQGYDEGQRDHLAVAHAAFLEMTSVFFRAIHGLGLHARSLQPNLSNGMPSAREEIAALARDTIWLGDSTRSVARIGFKFLEELEDGRGQEPPAEGTWGRVKRQRREGVDANTVKPGAALVAWRAFASPFPPPHAGGGPDQSHGEPSALDRPEPPHIFGARIEQWRSEVAELASGSGGAKGACEEEGHEATTAECRQARVSARRLSAVILTLVEHAWRFTSGLAASTEYGEKCRERLLSLIDEAREAAHYPLCVGANAAETARVISRLLNAGQEIEDATDYLEPEPRLPTLGEDTPHLQYPVATAYMSANSGKAQVDSAPHPARVYMGDWSNEGTFGKRLGDAWNCLGLRNALSHEYHNRRRSEAPTPELSTPAHPIVMEANGQAETNANPLVRHSNVNYDPAESTVPTLRDTVHLHHQRHDHHASQVPYVAPADGTTASPTPPPPPAPTLPHEAREPATPSLSAVLEALSHSTMLCESSPAPSAEVIGVFVSNFEEACRVCKGESAHAARALLSLAPTAGDDKAVLHSLVGLAKLLCAQRPPDAGHHQGRSEEVGQPHGGIRGAEQRRERDRGAEQRRERDEPWTTEGYEWGHRATPSQQWRAGGDGLRTSTPSHLPPPEPSTAGLVAEMVATHDNVIYQLHVVGTVSSQWAQRYSQARADLIHRYKQTGSSQEQAERDAIVILRRSATVPTEAPGWDGGPLISRCETCGLRCAGPCLDCTSPHGGYGGGRSAAPAGQWRNVWQAQDTCGGGRPEGAATPGDGIRQAPTLGRTRALPRNVSSAATRGTGANTESRRTYHAYVTSSSASGVHDRAATGAREARGMAGTRYSTHDVTGSGSELQHAVGSVGMATSTHNVTSSGTHDVTSSGTHDVTSSGSGPRADPDRGHRMAGTRYSTHNVTGGGSELQHAVGSMAGMATSTHNATSSGIGLRRANSNVEGMVTKGACGTKACGTMGRSPAQSDSNTLNHQDDGCHRRHDEHVRSNQERHQHHLVDGNSDPSGIGHHQLVDSNSRASSVHDVGSNLPTESSSDERVPAAAVEHNSYGHHRQHDGHAGSSDKHQHHRLLGSGSDTSDAENAGGNPPAGSSRNESVPAAAAEHRSDAHHRQHDGHVGSTHERHHQPADSNPGTGGAHNVQGTGTSGGTLNVTSGEDRRRSPVGRNPGASGVHNVGSGLPADTSSCERQRQRDGHVIHNPTASSSSYEQNRQHHELVGGHQAAGDLCDHRITILDGVGNTAGGQLPATRLMAAPSTAPPTSVGGAELTAQPMSASGASSLNKADIVGNKVAVSTAPAGDAAWATSFPSYEDHGGGLNSNELLPSGALSATPTAANAAANCPTPTSIAPHVNVEGTELAAAGTRAGPTHAPSTGTTADSPATVVEGKCPAAASSAVATSAALHANAGGAETVAANAKAAPVDTMSVGAEVDLPAIRATLGVAPGGGELSRTEDGQPAEATEHVANSVKAAPADTAGVSAREETTLGAAACANEMASQAPYQDFTDGQAPVPPQLEEAEHKRAKTLLAVSGGRTSLAAKPEAGVRWPAPDYADPRAAEEKSWKDGFPPDAEEVQEGLGLHEEVVTVRRSEGGQHHPAWESGEQPGGDSEAIAGGDGAAHRGTTAARNLWDNMAVAGNGGPAAGGSSSHGMLYVDDVLTLAHAQQLVNQSTGRTHWERAFVSELRRLMDEQSAVFGAPAGASNVNRHDDDTGQSSSSEVD